MKPNKDTRYKQINCRPDYILEGIDIWCRFWKLRCFVIGTWPKSRRVQIIHLRARIRVLHSQLTKWYETFHLMHIEASMYHCGTWDCLNWMYFGWNTCWRIDLCRAEPLICQVRKVKLHLNAPWTLRSQKFISYVAHSFKSLFWKLRDCLLTWNVFFLFEIMYRMWF